MKKYFSLLILIALLNNTFRLNAQWVSIGEIYSQQIPTIKLHIDALGGIYAYGTILDAQNNYYVAKYTNGNWLSISGTNTALFSPLHYKINSVLTDGQGFLYAAGNFTNAASHAYVAKWDGSQWAELGGPNSLAANWPIMSLCQDALGNIYAAGSFKNSNGECYVAKWNGSNWAQLGAQNLSATNTSGINKIMCDSNGNLYAAGYLINGQGKSYVAKFNGSSWSELGGANSIPDNSGITDFCLDSGGNLYAVGGFTNSLGFRYVAKYDGANWTELGGANSLAANNAVFSICADAQNNIYAGGDFRNVSGYRYVAKWDGTAWSELGGTNGLAADNYIWSLASDGNNNIYASGSFAVQSGLPYIAKYVKNYVGIHELNNESIPRIYPNPCTNKLELSFKENSTGTLKVMDISGKLLLTDVIENVNTKEINTSELNVGLYFLEIHTTNTKIERVKFIKE